MKKPPIGITPKRIHQELRLKEIDEAVIRYVAEDKPIPAEWVLEYIELTNELFLTK